MSDDTKSGEPFARMQRFMPTYCVELGGFVSVDMVNDNEGDWVAFDDLVAAVESRERAAWSRGAEAMREAIRRPLYRTIGKDADEIAECVPLPAYEPAPTAATGKGAT